MTSPVRELKIGRYTCRNNMFLAPMAGITDGPFRALCIKGGAGVAVGEMVSSQGLFRGNKRTERMLQLRPQEKPAAVQIFGGEAPPIELAARLACEAGADLVDINCGCPVKKIIRSGAGSDLMKDEHRFAAVVRAAVMSSTVPVTVKTRVGLRKGTLLSVQLARIAEAEGAKALFLHGRYAEDVHSGPVDFDAVARTCAAVKIPVIGNGGIKTAADAEQFFSAGCSGIMIGRAAVGNPFIFKALEAELSGGHFDSAEPRARAGMFLELVRQNVLFYGEKTGIQRSRKVAGYWISGFPDCARIRSAFVQLKTLEEVEALFAGERLKAC